MHHPLDNPVWHDLAGPHAGLALGHADARHYPRDVAPFSAVAAATPAAYADLATDLPRNLEARLFRPAAEPAPDGWDLLRINPILQMTASSESLPSALPAEASAVSLGAADAAEMLALAVAAKPGPFGPRTQELGRYVGARDANGRLSAMAGERFWLPGYVELSGICVHPDARGQGLGAALTVFLAGAALTRGEVPFLHVFPDNPAAALYERLGFHYRATLWVTSLRAAAASGVAA